jgi:molybdopterin-containing oxidoreductase family membrane subunit
MKTAQLNERQTTLLKRMGKDLTSVSVRDRILIGIMILFILVGMYGLYKQITEGHIVTGMRDHVVWGYYISNFVYFIGVSYAGAMLAGLLYYFRVSWGKPIIRIATLMAFITGIIGPVFILLCIGRFERLHHLFFFARVQSPITWDVMVITTYLVGVTVFAYLMLIKDMAIYRDTDLISFPKWKKNLYGALSLGYSGAPGQDQELDAPTRSMSLIMIPKVILAFAVLSWIFGMTLRPGWQSTIFGPSFIVSSIATGIGLIIALMWVYRKLYGLEDYLTDDHFKRMGFILFFLTFVFGYFSFTEYATDWYATQEWNNRMMNHLYGMDGYGLPMLISNLVCILFPLVVIGFKRFRTTNLISITSILLVIAMWVRRYLTIVPTQEVPLIPMQDTRPEYINYTATWVEWTLIFAGAATFFAFFLIITKFLTIVPVSAYAESEEQEAVV